MNRLKEFLENHDKQEFRDLHSKSLNELTGLQEYGTVRELIANFDIRINVFALTEFNTDILWLVEYDNEAKKFKWLSQYIFSIAIPFMLIFPILVANYWLYFALLLIPISIFASSIIKSPVQTLFWLIIIGLILYSLISGNYDIYGMVLPAIILLVGPKRAKTLYRETMIKSAMRNELNFKFLWFIGMIQLHNRQTDEFFSIYNTQ